ncbi:hypothetical protein N9Z25_08375 [Luminiphilus sp.]|nr:hypothetical protein [Luminiphilus sp.]
MKYLVIGRGFASYGYVPALAAMGREVWVPSVLFDRLQSRQFLDPADLLNVRRIETFDVELDAIVLAVRPSELQHLYCFGIYRTLRFLMKKQLGFLGLVREPWRTPESDQAQRRGGVGN